MLNGTQTGLLLAKISTFDNRSITAEIIDSWTEALKSYVTVSDAKQAVADFYGDPKWVDRRAWIMPADVNARCRKLVNDRQIRAQIEASSRRKAIESSKPKAMLEHHFIGNIGRTPLEKILGKESK